jgi:hypothetical protein
MIPIPAPLPGRPFYISIDGGRLYVSVHDAYHLERERQFKREIRLAHPDRNRQRWACSRTRNLLKARARWEAEEARWYARFGLEPPTRLPLRTSSVGDESPGIFAFPPTPAPPVADRHPSSFTIRRTPASPVVSGRDHNTLADVICTSFEQDRTRSFIPTCHGPPARRVAPVGMRGRWASLASAGDMAMSTALASAVESWEVHAPLANIDAPTTLRADSIPFIRGD